MSFLIGFGIGLVAGVVLGVGALYAAIDIGIKRGT